MFCLLPWTRKGQRLLEVCADPTFLGRADLSAPLDLLMGDELLALTRAWLAGGETKIVWPFTLRRRKQKGQAEGKTGSRQQVSNAELSSQMAHMSELLPELADQLTAMRLRQQTMEKQLASPSGPARICRAEGSALAALHASGPRALDFAWPNMLPW